MVLFQMDEDFNCIWHEPKQNWMFLMRFFATEFFGTKPTYFLLLILTCLPLAIVIPPPPVNKTWGKDLCGSLQQNQHDRGKSHNPKYKSPLFYSQCLLADCVIFILFTLFLPPSPEAAFGPLAPSVFSVPVSNPPVPDGSPMLLRDDHFQHSSERLANICPQEIEMLLPCMDCAHPRALRRVRK